MLFTRDEYSILYCISPESTNYIYNIFTIQLNSIDTVQRIYIYIYMYTSRSLSPNPSDWARYTGKSFPTPADSSRAWNITNISQTILYPLSSLYIYLKLLRIYTEWPGPASSPSSTTMTIPPSPCDPPRPSHPILPFPHHPNPTITLTPSTLWLKLRPNLRRLARLIAPRTMPPVAVAQPSSPRPPIPLPIRSHQQQLLLQPLRLLQLQLPLPWPVFPTPVAVQQTPRHHKPHPRWVDPRTRDEASGRINTPVPTLPAMGVPRRSRHPAMQPGMARNIPARRACIVRSVTRRLRARIIWSSISGPIARIRRIWTTMRLGRRAVRGNGLHQCSASNNSYITGQRVSPAVGCWMRPRDRRHIDEDMREKWQDWLVSFSWVLFMVVFVSWANDGRNGWRISSFIPLIAFLCPDDWMYSKILEIGVLNRGQAMREPWRTGLYPWFCLIYLHLHLCLWVSTSTPEYIYGYRWTVCECMAMYMGIWPLCTSEWMHNRQFCRYIEFMMSIQQN